MSKACRTRSARNRARYDGAIAYVDRKALRRDGAGGRYSEGRRCLLGLLDASWTEQEIGDVVGVSQQSIALYAIGARQPNQETIYAFEDFFGAEGFAPRVWFQEPRPRAFTTLVEREAAQSERVDAEVGADLQADEPPTAA